MTKARPPGSFQAWTRFDLDPVTLTTRIERRGNKHPTMSRDKHTNGETPLPAVSSDTLARCLGVSPKIIYDLAKAGIIERSSSRLFPLEDSVRRYCEYLRRQTAGGSS